MCGLHCVILTVWQWQVCDVDCLPSSDAWCWLWCWQCNTVRHVGYVSLMWDADCVVVCNVDWVMVLDVMLTVMLTVQYCQICWLRVIDVGCRLCGVVWCWLGDGVGRDADCVALSNMLTAVLLDTQCWLYLVLCCAGDGWPGCGWDHGQTGGTAGKGEEGAAGTAQGTGEKGNTHCLYLPLSGVSLFGKRSGSELREKGSVVLSCTVLNINAELEMPEKVAFLSEFCVQ